MADLYQVALRMSLGGVQSLNILNYVTDSSQVVVSRAYALAYGLGGISRSTPIDPSYPTGEGTLITTLRDTLSEAVQFLEMSVFNIYDPVDFYQVLFPSVVRGKQNGQCLPPHCSFGLTSSIVRRDIRRGQKRFFGVPETANESGQVVGGFGGSITTALNNPAVYEDEGVELVFRNCILGKEKYTPDATKPDRVAYRYYGSKSEQLARMASNVTWSVKPQVRTQVTRQYGRGI